MRVEKILETALYVDDVERAKQFYRDVLGAVFYSEQPGQHVFFQVGRQMLLLFNPDSSRDQDGEIPAHGADGRGHVAFAAEADQLEGWERQLADHGVQIERRIEWPGGGRSLYFRDPAGNSLELATETLWHPRESG